MAAILAAIFFSALLGGFLALQTRRELRRQEILAKQNAKAPEISVTLIEGWNLEDTANYLQKSGIASPQQFAEAQKNIDAQKYSFLAVRPKGASLEGFVFPDTYRLLKPDRSDTQAAEALLKKALENFGQKFTSQMEVQAKSLNMSVFDIITLASIIEKETGRNVTTNEQKQKLDQERKIVAGIFYNRLKIGMALESDATINYITKKNDPTASAVDLNSKSLYNTYKYKGLPPGPICNPSLSSIMSALNPAQTEYYFFLHKQPSGEVVYSKTFGEHVQNKFKYLK